MTAMDGLSGRGKAICCWEAFSTGGEAGGKAIPPEHCGTRRHEKDTYEGDESGPAPGPLLWLSLSRSLYRYPGLHQDLVSGYRFGDILDGLLPQILVPQGQLGLDVIKGGLGDTDPTGLRQGLQPRRDVHPVAVDAIFLLDHIPQVNPDAELHSPGLG